MYYLNNNNMDIKSLRIGNIVQAGVKKGTSAVVILLKEEGAIARTEKGIEMEQISPFNLTESILTNLKFEQSGNRIYKKACIRVEVKDISTSSGKKEPQFMIKLEDSSQWKKIITGVHELQNFYYEHTGQELTNE
jgi:hypothetical protein